MKTGHASRDHDLHELLRGLLLLLLDNNLLLHGRPRGLRRAHRPLEQTLSFLAERSEHRGSGIAAGDF